MCAPIKIRSGLSLAGQREQNKKGTPAFVYCFVTTYVCGVRCVQSYRQTNGWNLRFLEPSVAVAVSVGGVMFVISIDSAGQLLSPVSLSSWAPLRPPDIVAEEHQSGVGADGSSVIITVDPAADIRRSSRGDEDVEDDGDCCAFRRPLADTTGPEPLTPPVLIPDPWPSSVVICCCESSSSTVTATWSLSLSHSSTINRCVLTNRSNTSTPETSVCTATSAVLATDDLCW